ncbi:NAD-binding protein [Candidatus Woesearchaeota archaeon]|nr:NAD-binding protein [Candidatus Woesearchaeota archaeon]
MARGKKSYGISYITSTLHSQQLDDGVLVQNKVLILASMLAFLFLFGTVGYMVTKGVSAIDGLVFTLETLTFLHDPETGSPKIVQVFLLLFGSFFLWWVLWTTFDLVLEGGLEDYFKGVNLMNKVKELKNHWIICGAGRVGTHVAELMIAKNEPYVLIDKDINVAAIQTKKGFLVVDGDALEEDTLLACGIKDARGFIAVIPETEKNVLAILTAKELNPNLEIYARAHRKEYTKKLKKAGAQHVFMPEYTCAEEIYKKISEPKKT